MHELLLELFALRLHGSATPFHGAGLHRQQTGQTSQQARLADAIGAYDLQQLSLLERERSAAKQVPLSAPQVHVVRIEPQASVRRHHAAENPSLPYNGARV